MLESVQNETSRRELMANLSQLSGEQLVRIQDTKYVAANLVKKTNSDRLILHVVNYHTPLKNVHVTVNLDGVAKKVDAKRIRLYSPDREAVDLVATSVRGNSVEFVLPELDVYDVVTIN
jgi:alpha-L-arabinofuranosidase